eukprot:jgi/Mesen1/6014/ME000306S05281
MTSVTHTLLAGPLKVASKINTCNEASSSRINDIMEQNRQRPRLFLRMPQRKCMGGSRIPTRSPVFSSLTKPEKQSLRVVDYLQEVQGAAERFAAGAAIAAVLLGLSPQALAEASAAPPAPSLCQIAAAAPAVPPLPIGGGAGDGDRPGFMMGGMSAPNFDARRYMGRWYEVASIKKGFAGQGQEDCHCTQGIYTLDEANKSIEVDTFCVHGSPAGYITGIRGKVACVAAEEREARSSGFERDQMIVEKCYLRFPSIPFIPKSTYNVIATDYDNFALVSGAQNFSFVQVYSRVPNPGEAFISEQKERLASLGYDRAAIKDTPQDCEVVGMDVLESMMSKPGMQDAMDNVLPGARLPSSQVELERALQTKPLFTSFLDGIQRALFGS